MKFVTKESHGILTMHVTPWLGFFTFRDELGMFAFIHDNRETVRMAHARQGADHNFNYTLTVTPKKESKAA